MALKIGSTTVADLDTAKISISQLDPATVPSSFVSKDWVINGVVLIPDDANGPYAGASVTKVYSVSTNDPVGAGDDPNKLTIRYTTNCNCKCKCQCKCKCKCKCKWKCLCACKCQCKCKCACLCECKCNCKCWSDSKLKNDVETAQDTTLEKIKQLQVITYKYNEQGLDLQSLMEEKPIDNMNTEQLGLLAQELEQAFPEIVDKVDIDNEEYRAVAYMKLIPVLIQSIKELDKKIDDINNDSQNKDNDEHNGN